MVIPVVGNGAMISSTVRRTPFTIVIFDVDGVVDVLQRVALDEDHVGELARLERAEVVVDAQELGRTRGSTLRSAS